MSILLIIVIIFFSGGCHRDTLGNGYCIIDGSIIGMAGKTVYLKEVGIKKVIPVDSAKLSSNDGQFTFKLKISEPDFYIIQTEKNDYYPLVLAQGDKIYFQADIFNPQRSYTVNGSDDSNLLKKYTDFTNRNEDRIKQLNQVFIESQDLPDFEKIRDSLNLIYDSIFRDEQDSVKSIIGQHPGSLASLFIINQRLGPQTILNEKDHLRYFLTIDSALMIWYPSNKHTIDHHTRMALYREAEAERRLSLERLRVGSEAPDIHLTDPQGIMQKLSDYRGKIVILDFWAAWCQPCRKENQILSQLYKKYNKQGLEIFSVSLDNKKDLWIRAINVDKITWVQVSDLKYPSSPIQKLYNLEEIPQSYILDREGRIIAHNLKGEDLDKRIKDLLEKY